MFLAYGVIMSIQGICNSSFLNDDVGIEIVSIINVDIVGISLVGVAIYDGLFYNSDFVINLVFFVVLGGMLNISNLEYN